MEFPAVGDFSNSDNTISGNANKADEGGATVGSTRHSKAGASVNYDVQLHI
jgi:hypothetical protein